MSFILLVVAIAFAFTAGFVAGVKNANSQKVAAVKDAAAKLSK